MPSFVVSVRVNAENSRDTNVSYSRVIRALSVLAVAGAVDDALTAIAQPEPEEEPPS